MSYNMLFSFLYAVHYFGAVGPSVSKSLFYRRLFDIYWMCGTCVSLWSMSPLEDLSLLDRLYPHIERKRNVNSFGPFSLQGCLWMYLEIFIFNASGFPKQVGQQPSCKLLCVSRSSMGAWKALPYAKVTWTWSAISDWLFFSIQSKWSKYLSVTSQEINTCSAFILCFFWALTQP